MLLCKLMRKNFWAACFAAAVLGLLYAGSAAAHEGHGHAPAKRGVQGKAVKQAQLGVSAAVDADGKLWVLSTESTRAGDFALLRSSNTEGKTWSAPRRINAVAEPIAAHGEDVPKLVLGPHGRMYASWTRPGTKNYSGDIRFSRSIDDGQTWSPAINVHHDAQMITHRYGSMLVDGSGRLFIIWIDKRDAEAAKNSKREYQGGAMYYAVSDDEGVHWRGDFKVADNSCECCRIALVADADGAPLAFWRHVFDGDVRDHALVKLTPDGKPPAIARATFDGWQIEACPHHGPAVAVAGQVRHAVWYSFTEGQGKVFYGRLQAGKVEGQRALTDPRAEHADIIASGQQVWIVWKSFDGKNINVGLRHSKDGGLVWNEQNLASSDGNTDDPHLLLHGATALLVWSTQKQGVLIRKLP
jgi:hypothetical protein